MERGLAEFCGWTNGGGRGKGRGLATILVRVGRKPQRALVDTASACSLVQRGLVDTALACSLVQRGLVEPHWLIPRVRMKPECIHRDWKHCPMAQVPLEVRGKFS